MPYTPDHNRRAEVIRTLKPETAGELNMLLFHTALKYLMLKGMRYQHCDDIMEAYEEALLCSTQFNISLENDSFPSDKEELVTYMCYIVYQYGAQTDKSAKGTVRASQYEFYRRYIAPYEDEAKEKNGDVIWQA